MAEKTDIVVRILAEQQKFNKQLAMARRDMRKTQSSFASIGKSMSATLAGVFAVDTIIDFGKGVVNTRKEFERLETVLGVTLGSQSEAQKAFKDIQKFASETPFSVLELSDSFVKLTNFGLKPTIPALRAYGDLASSTGKSFDQLAEAIIDATTGEFERLKEFGIRASKQGDKVEFTFKGVKKQVDFTSDSIREYIQSLGEAKGVSGAMEAQSKTLGGAISNLGDKFEDLQNKLGKELEPYLLQSIKFMGEMIDAVANLGFVVDVLFTSFKNLSDVQIRKIVDLGGITETGKAIKTLINGFTELDHSRKSWKTIQDEFVDIFVKEGETIEDATRLWKAYELQIAKIFADKSNTTESPTPAPPSPKKTAYVPGTIQPIENLDDELDFNFGSLDYALDQLKAFSGPLAGMEEELDKVNKRLKELNEPEFDFAWLDKLKNEMVDPLKALAKELDMILEQTIEQSIAGFAHAIGSGNKLGEAFAGILSTIGNGITAIGVATLAYGIGMKKFQESLLTLNAPVAIAAGIGLIAAGAAITASSKKLGGALGGGRSGSGGGGQPRFGGSSVNVQGEFKIKGRDLVYIFNEEQKRNGRVG